MKELWSKRIRDMVPYVPGEQPGDRVFIKLNTNENPYPPSPKALEAMAGAAGESLRLYPDPECAALRRTIAGFHGLDPAQVFPGNGSDEILAFCFQAFFDRDRLVLFPDITYSFYAVYAAFFGLTVRLLPLNGDFSMPVEDFQRTSCGGVVLANPNAPTGMGLDLDTVRAVIQAHRDAVVLVDEAYIDFGGETAATLVNEFSNLVVVRTLSKSRSLAGLRVGYALGNPDLMAALRCVRDSINSYTVDRLAQAGAAAAMADRAWFEETRRKIMDTRAWVTARLRKLGFTVPESQANFVFASHPRHDAKALLASLRDRGILVRYFDKPRIDNYLRITIGTDAEMESLCTALAELTEG